MTLIEKTDLVRRSFAAFMTAARADIDAILHPDFTFTSPYDDQIGRDDYFTRCWPNAGSFERLQIQQLCAADDGCFVLYEGRSKRGASFRNTEYFRFEDGLIRSVEVFFGLEPGGAAAVPPAS
ncbi:MAG: nuclear transport factor 2 family protein [Acetobacteraceae bacterium]